MKYPKYFHNKDNDLLSKKQIEIKQKFFDLMDQAMHARTAEEIKALIAKCNAFEASLDGAPANMAYIMDTLVSKASTKH